MIEHILKQNPNKKYLKTYMKAKAKWRAATLKQIRAKSGQWIRAIEKDVIVLSGRREEVVWLDDEQDYDPNTQNYAFKQED